MNRSFVALLLLTGCTIDNGFGYRPPRVNEPDPGSVRGRVCDPTGRSWLPDAMIYTNLVDEDGIILETRRTFSDRDGNWQIDGLPGNREYTIYIQSGPELLDEVDVFLGDAQQLAIPASACFDPTALDIALVTGDYDDVDHVLEELGFTSYTVIDGTDPVALQAFLTDPVALARHDLVFFNGGHTEHGIIHDTNPANLVPSRVAANLEAYVQSGGSVFATDWAYDVVEHAWPGAIDFMGDDRIADAAQLGEYDLIDAAVTDESLAAFLGSPRIGIEYDLPVWPPISAVEPYVSIHLSGTVRYREGQSSYTLASVPLLVSFSDGQGRVGFSTFRFAANHDEDTRLTLQHILGTL